jgi:tetratricopeptide (TPR) repeat protein
MTRESSATLRDFIYRSGKPIMEFRIPARRQAVSILLLGLIGGLCMCGCGARYNEVQRYIRQEQYSLAEKQLAVETLHDAQGWYLLAICRYHSKDYPGLAEAATRSLKLSQEYRSPLSYHLQKAFVEQLRVALKEFDLRDFPNASQHLNQLLVFSKSIDPKMKVDIEVLREQIMSLAAHCSFQMKDFPQAQSYLETLSVQWKDNYELLERLAYTYYYVGQLAQCVATCERILAVQPSNSNMLGLRAQAVQKQGANEAAVNAYRDALSGGTNQAVLNRNIGVLFFAMKDWAQARKHLENALKGNPSDKDKLLSMTAECCYYEGNYNAALGYYKQLNTLQPNHPDLIRALGSCYWSMGNHTAAEAAFAEASRLAHADSTKSATDTTASPQEQTKKAGE